MMRIQIISDVHMEFHADGGDDYISRLVPSDVLVIAGDLCSRSAISDVLKKLCDAFADVVYVLGNHEAYGATIRMSKDSVPSLSNLHFLDNSEAIIHGQRFLGGTLWFSYDSMNDVFANRMSDFSHITDARCAIYEENGRSKNFLEGNVKTSDIVVTHHMPSYACVSRIYRDSELNRFFVTDMDHLIFSARPRLWIHGHTHDSKDFMHGDTRIVCNPFGYAGHGLNREYCDKILEIP